MNSIIITSYKEPELIERAIRAFASQTDKDEIIVVAPDIETLKAADKLKSEIKNLKVIRDEGKRKPAALNLAVSKARGEILILSDGDVYVSKNAVHELLDKFKDEKVGAVTGRPINLDDKNTKYGYWAEALTRVAHELRLKANKKNKKFFCSGYLFAIRREIFPTLDENLLSDDGYISHKVLLLGYKIQYSPNAEVYVHYPTNFRDWIAQKQRSAGGYKQLKEMTGSTFRSLEYESIYGIRMIFYPRNIREVLWMIELFFARIWLWLLIMKNVKGKVDAEKLWVQVGSTKR